MPTATRNRPKTVSVSKTALDQVGSLLLDLSAKPKEEMSLREAIDELREPIQNALAKGYSYEDVVSILGEKGIKTTAATVKRYISLGNPRNRKTRTAAAKTKTRRTPAAVEVVEATAPEKAPAPPKKTTRTRSAAKPVEPVVLPAKGRRKSAAASVDSAQTKVKTTPKASKTTAAKTTRASAKPQASAAKSATRGRKKSG